MFDSLQKFISFWYLRYLLVTELYMVEKWERIMIYIVFAFFFMTVSLFNMKIVLAGVDMMVKHHKEWMLLPSLDAALRSII